MNRAHADAPGGGSPSAPTAPTFSDAVRRRFVRLRWENFAYAWLIYVAFYLIRKNFDGAKPGMMAALGELPAEYTKVELGTIDASFLVTYALAQFLAGPLGDRFGAKKTVLGGLVLASLANLAFGVLHPVSLLSLAWGVNGVAQAFGFPLCCKIVAAWFPLSMRGRASAWFLTSYTLGDIAAKALAGTMLNEAGWRWAFFAPVGIVAGLLVLFALRLRGAPQDAGLPEVAVFDSEPEDEPVAKAGEGPRFGAELIELLRRPAVWLVCATYFLLKMARYTFLGWSNVFLFEQLGYKPGDATLATIPIMVGGVVGTVAAGYASDKLFQGRRAPVAVLSILGLALVTPLYAQLQPGQRELAIVLHLAVGLFAFAADSIMSMAVAMDLASGRGAASAAGLINGVGSVGAILSPALGAWASTQFGWTWAWYVLSGLLVLSAAATATRWNKVGRA